MVEIVIVNNKVGLLEWLAEYLYPHEHKAHVFEDRLEWHPFGLEPCDPENYAYRIIPVVRGVCKEPAVAFVKSLDEVVEVWHGDKGFYLK